MSASSDSQPWTVEELGEAHAEVSCPSTPQAFIVPRAALPSGVQEGDRLSVSGEVNTEFTVRDPSLKASDEAGGTDQIFSEALENLAAI